MAVAKEQIRQIISENNISSVADVYTLLKDSFKEILQELMEAELDATLGYEKNHKGDLQTDNKRNGHSTKNLKSQYGEFQIDVPRDRNGEFEPKLIPKYQRDISGIEEKVKSLFTEDLVKLVIGFEKGSHGVRPFFCRNIEEADKLVWDDFCTNNIAVYLTKTELFGTDKTALFANLPALRTILQLASENQLKQEQWIILTLNAQEEVIQFDNFEDIYAYMADYPMLTSEEDRQLIEKIQNMTREDRWQYWIHEMSKCIKCYACRAVCPLCYCNRCIVEVNCPQWIQAWSAPLTNMEWQVNRVMHMAGRCVECGACAKACPVGIPLHLLTQNMMETIRHEFEKQPGNLGNKGNVLATFRVEDKEDFIH